jgi:para-nitrobenzyl esterase
MRTFLTGALISVAAPIALFATQATAAEATAQTGYSVETTDLGTLLDNAEAKAVLMKHIPTLIGNEQISMARSMTLKQIQQYAGDTLTDAKLAEIQTDLIRAAPHERSSSR